MNSCANWLSSCCRLLLLVSDKLFSWTICHASEPLLLLVKINLLYCKIHICINCAGCWMELLLEHLLPGQHSSFELASRFASACSLKLDNFCRFCKHSLQQTARVQRIDSSLSDSLFSLPMVSCSFITFETIFDSH